MKIEIIKAFQDTGLPERKDKCSGCGKDILTNLPNPVYCMKCEDVKKVFKEVRKN